MTCFRAATSLLLLLGFVVSSAEGQYRSSFELEFAALSDRSELLTSRLLDLSVVDSGLGETLKAQPDNTHARKLAGLGAGVTVGAGVLSLDALVGSSCIGSGDYLRGCRLAFLGGTVVTGGLGALIGMFVRRESPPGRITDILVGSASGSMGAFAASALICEQEGSSNPDLICGHDGMVTSLFVLGIAAIGGAIGGVVSDSSDQAEFGKITTARGPSGELAWELVFTFHPN